MAFETIVVAFSTAQQATSAIHALRALGIPPGDIKRHPVEPITEVGAKEASAPEGGIWEWFFGRQILAQDTATYEQAIKNGGTMVSVRVIGDEVDRVIELLNSFAPLNLESL